jgi:hypothetical protein
MRCESGKIVSHGLPFLSCTEAIEPSRGQSQHSTEELFFLLTTQLDCAVKDS